MKIWLPKPLYLVFPLLCVLLGFTIAVLLQNPAGIAIAGLLYIYSFAVLWLRTPGTGP